MCLLKSSCTNAKIATNRVALICRLDAISDGKVTATRAVKHAEPTRARTTHVIERRGAYRHSWTK